MAVEILAGPVVTHSRARIGVAGRDLDVTQVNPRVKHGRDIRYLYSILKSAWSGVVSVSESRERRG